MQRIVFHHINKCAGTTVLQYLRGFSPADRQLHVEADVTSYRRPVTSFDDHLLARTMFVHDPFGVCDWLGRLGGASTMCFFRDPVARLLSNWKMICRWSEDEVAATPEGRLVFDLAQEGPEAFFASRHPGVRRINYNGMVGHLMCDPHAWNNAWNDGSIDSPAFQQLALGRAEKVVRNLSFVGKQEDFQRSIEMLQLWLKLPPGQPQKFNVTPSSGVTIDVGAASGVSPDLVSLDGKLFAMANEIYERQVEEYHKEFGRDFVSAADSRYQVAIETPPEQVVVDMADAAPGAGWHAQEVNGIKHSRWIGPDSKAFLNFRINKDKDLLLRFRVTNILRAAQIECLQIRADQKVLETHTWRESEFVLIVDAVAPSAGLNRDRETITIEIDCAVTVCLQGDDERLLGLEICEVEVGPLQSYIVGSRGTPTGGQRTTIA